ncbi:Uncharacterised protein [Bordetella pertussis]|nr:Uncharacterised protein [Bordetella pertussis]
MAGRTAVGWRQLLGFSCCCFSARTAGAARCGI